MLIEDLEQTIHEVVLQIAKQKTATIEKVENHDHLTQDLGFRSLDLAQLVAILEFKVGVDPFAKLVPVTSIRTVGDVCDAYRRCFSSDQEPAAVLSLPQRQARGEARRRVSAKQRGVRNRARHRTRGTSEIS